MDLINGGDANFGKGASPEKIDSAELRLGLHFACDYKKYLSTYGMMQIGSRELTGIGASDHLNVVSVTERWRSYGLGVPNDWYVLEILGFDGLVAWQDKNGFVYLASPDGASKKVANGLQEYLML